MTLERRNKVFDIIITHSIAEGHPRLCQTVQCGIFYSYSSQPNYARTYLQLPLRQWGAGNVLIITGAVNPVIHLTLLILFAKWPAN